MNWRVNSTAPKDRTGHEGTQSEVTPRRDRRWAVDRHARDDFGRWRCYHTISFLFFRHFHVESVPSPVYFSLQQFRSGKIGNPRELITQTDSFFFLRSNLPCLFRGSHLSSDTTRGGEEKKRSAFGGRKKMRLLLSSEGMKFDLFLYRLFSVFLSSATSCSPN